MPNSEWVDLDLFEDAVTTQANEAAWQDKRIEKLFAAVSLDKTKLKTLAAAGIPPQMRASVYPKLLKTHMLSAHESDFARAQARTHGLVIPASPIPPSFGGRTQLSRLALTPAGLDVVNHILCILAHDNPTLEFCPFLPPLVAMLAHHIDTADALLACVASLLRLNGFTHPAQTQDPRVQRAPAAGSLMPGESTPSRRWLYIPTHKKEAKLFSRAFGNLLYQTDRKLHGHLTDLHSTSPDPFWTPWMQHVFIDVFPQPVLWRFLDCFLVEGYKSFLRFGMAVLKMHRDTLMQLQSLDELRQFVRPVLFDEALRAARLGETKGGRARSASRSRFATIADEIAATAAGVFINYANVKRVHEHHASLAAVSQDSSELLEDSASLRYQRALPKFVGAGVASMVKMQQQQQADEPAANDGQEGRARPVAISMGRPRDGDAGSSPGAAESSLGDAGISDSDDAISVASGDVLSDRFGSAASLSASVDRHTAAQSGHASKMAVPRIVAPMPDDSRDDGVDGDVSSTAPTPVGRTPASAISATSAASGVSNISTKSSSDQAELLPASTIASTDYWIALWSWIPPQRRTDALELVFTTKVHGCLLRTLYSSLRGRRPVILAIETLNNEIFGAYLSEGLPDLVDQPELAGKWVGNGENFIFSLMPHAKMFPWVGRLNESMSGPSFFVNATPACLTIGGGGEDVAIQLDDALQSGITGRCTTFNNDYLTKDKGFRFEVLVVEAFAFTID
ncbi:hypothetical protein HK105_202341 [Polyrhizophydium stewartii]|uniref:Oxidation resistance protein 1 n=1 Tax=Polyrhizophydium stewartii TaxID=2732419 RepID=A0ABR4NEI0_9FUNG